MNSRRSTCHHCGSLLNLDELPPGEQRDCPNCGEPVERVSHSIDPAESAPGLSSRILQTLLDPRSIQWLLMIGGGLSVLGLLIYLISIGLFDNPLYAATALGIGSLALLGSGWGVVIKTRYRMAGQALTFLACVVMPLNLWFYDAQGLLLVENHLWLAGLVCCTLYVATVYVLRDALFLYAVEAGITLTVMLFLGHRGWVGHLSAWSVALLILGMISLHLEQAFPAKVEEDFSRKKFGKPLFHSGLLQLIASTAILLVVQTVSWFTPPDFYFLGFDWSAGELIRHPWLAASLWLLAMYAWLFAEWQHPSKGIYSSLGLASLILGEVTLVAGHLYYEGAIAVMSVTALLFHLGLAYLYNPEKETEQRRLSWLGFGLLAIPFGLGFLLQIRSLVPIPLPDHLFYQTGNYYLPVMVLLWITTLVAAITSRQSTTTCQTLKHLLGAATLLLTISEALRDYGYGVWSIQGVTLIPVAILYLVASRFRRGTNDENSLALAGHISIGITSLSVFVAALVDQPLVFQPVAGSRETLLLGILAIEMATFYLLARIWKRHAINLYLSTAFLAAAIWQFLGYAGVVQTYYTACYAALGLVLIIAARILGIHEITTEVKSGTTRQSCQGRGLTLFQCGNAIFLFAIGATVLQGLSRLLTDRVEFSSLIVVGSTILISLIAVTAAPNGNWRRTYLTAIAWLGVLFALTLNRLSLLNGWQKLEIVTTVVGVILLGAGCIGRLRERTGRPDDKVSLLLAVGSLFAIVPPFIALLYFRWFGPSQSLGDEFALLTVTILMLLIGLTLQLKTPTICGGTALTLYLGILIAQLAYHPQVAIGVYLAIGGILLFATGVVLSIYRDRLLALPEKIARREGIFRIIDWR